MSASRRKSYGELRSARWYGASDLRSFGHRSRTKQMGFAADDYAGKPVIAILKPPPGTRTGRKAQSA